MKKGEKDEKVSISDIVSQSKCPFKTLFPSTRLKNRKAVLYYRADFKSPAFEISSLD